MAGRNDEPRPATRPVVPADAACWVPADRRPVCLACAAGARDRSGRCADPNCPTREEEDGDA